MILWLTQLSWSNGKTSVGEAEKRRRNSGSSPELSKLFKDQFFFRSTADCFPSRFHYVSNDEDLKIIYFPQKSPALTKEWQQVSSRNSHHPICKRREPAPRHTTSQQPLTNTRTNIHMRGFNEPLATDMSTVMKVHIQPHDPLPSSPEKAFTAALKLYDRRFGTGLRGRLDLTPPEYEPCPCTISKEAAYCDFIRNKEVDAPL